MRRSNFRLSGIFRRISSLLYPPACPLCGRITGSHIDGVLCPDCLQKFSADSVTVCPECGREPDLCACAPNLSDGVFFASDTEVKPLVFWGYYTGYDKDSAVSALVYRMKRSRDRQACVFFARLLAESILRMAAKDAAPGSAPDLSRYLLTYIPRSASAEDKYGFDHMNIVAEVVAEMTGAKLLRVFRRSGGTEQKGLTADERKRNAASTLSLQKSVARALRGKDVIVLDDIVTTGSTVSRAAELFSLAGARTVVPAAVMLSKTGHKNLPRR